MKNPVTRNNENKVRKCIQVFFLHHFVFQKKWEARVLEIEPNSGIKGIKADVGTCI
jgi:hypothetical protein